MGFDYDWMGIADAEDLFHPGLLRMVDYRFRAHRRRHRAVRVQLMNFSHPTSAPPEPECPHAATPSPVPRRPAALQASGAGASVAAMVRHASSAGGGPRTCLEYYKWFQSRLKLQAASVIPLGGNTVFFRRRVPRRAAAKCGRRGCTALWDEDCLTEDCKIGIAASVLGLSGRRRLRDAHGDPRGDSGHAGRARCGSGCAGCRASSRSSREREWLRLPSLWQRVTGRLRPGIPVLPGLHRIVLAPFALALVLAQAPVAMALLHRAAGDQPARTSSWTC